MWDRITKTRIRNFDDLYDVAKENLLTMRVTKVVPKPSDSNVWIGHYDVYLSTPY